MKKILFAAVGLSALAAAAPAAAQYYPAPQYGYGQPAPYGYNQPQGYGYNQPQGYGYNNNQRGLVQSYLVRADQLRQRIERFDSRDRITERDARRLRAAAIDLQNRTRSYAANGLNNRERYDLDQRFARLQQAIQIQVRDGRRPNGNAYGWDNNRDRDRDGRADNRDGYVDRNRNGVDDRLERDRDRDDDGRLDRYDGFVDANRNGIDDRAERRLDRDDD